MNNFENNPEVSSEENSQAATQESTVQVVEPEIIERTTEEIRVENRKLRAAGAAAKRSKITYERKKSLYGYGFISVWLIGVVFFFLVPLINSLIYSFHETSVEPGGLVLKWVGLGNYQNAIYGGDQNFMPYLTNSLSLTLQKTILVLIFSLFIAVIINQKFRGRVIARAIFFLPVIIATGPVISVINGDMGTQGVQNAEQFSTLFETDLVGSLMEFIGIYNISQSFTEMIQSITSDIFNYVWNSGVQILIFLAALQNIPVTAKEAAQMEGATAWEYFWKITIPYVSPMILANIIYTVIDSFVDPANEVMVYVRAQAAQWKHGYSSALAWIYFVIIAIALAIVVAIVSKFVYYEVD